MQTASAQQRSTHSQVVVAPGGTPRTSRAPVSRRGWRWQYSAHPSLMPTVYVPGPVVTDRKV